MANNQKTHSWDSAAVALKKHSGVRINFRKKTIDFVNGEVGIKTLGLIRYMKRCHLFTVQAVDSL